MKLHELHPPEGAKKERKRIARGDSGRSGKYAGRGRKGQKARSGGNIPAYFEGGQTPLVRSLPYKRGFKPPFKKEYNIVNVDNLEARFQAGDEVSPEALVEAGLLKSTDEPIKVLGRGQINKELSVKAHAFSSSAREKIEAAGGSVEEIEEWF